MSSYATIKCPKCKRLISIPRSYAYSLGGVIKFAIDHEDHVLVVGFDRFGIIRYIDVFKKIKSSSIGRLKAICPRCNKTIYIPDENFFDKFAILHDDHTVIIFKARNEVEIEVVNNIRSIIYPPEPNILKKLLRKINKDEIAAIIIKLIKNPDHPIRVSAHMEELIKVFIKKTLGISRLNIKYGMPEKITNEKVLKFLIKKMDEVENISSDEALEILRESIELVQTILDSLEKVKALYGIKEMCRYLQAVRSNNEDLYHLLTELIEVKC